MSSVVAISAVAGKKGLERIIGNIYDTSKGQLRMRFKRWKTKKNIGTLYTQIKKIRRVKTILQPEKVVDLMKFYYPSKILIDGKRKTIKDISELSWEGNIVIKGTVGQGKSIFFRYIASREMVKGNAVPLFAELRRIKKNHRLVDHLVDEANALGLKGLDEETFFWLAEQGKVILLLDGFDEVPEEQRLDLITEIELLSRTYEKMQILVSSRPNSGIEKSPFFSVFELDELKNNEYEDAIRVMAEQSAAESIVEAVRLAPSNVREMLTTPLMVALLIVRHRIEQAIPENVVGFYEGLFGLLVNRHDKMKGGYTRPRKSGLGDSALQDVFEGICFLTKKEGQSWFEHRSIAYYTEESIQLTGHESDPDAALEDIAVITCLILQEGDEWRFVHKSVQEYHSACFIKQQPDEIARRFYENIRKSLLSTWIKWEEVLLFLRQIDKYRCMKWLAIPGTCALLDLNQRVIPKSINVTTHTIENLFQGLGRQQKESGSTSWQITLHSSAGSCLAFCSLLGLDIFKDLHTLDIKDAKESTITSMQSIRIWDWSSLVPFCKEWAKEKIKKVHLELIAAAEYVRRVEARNKIFDL